jgi:hypothetical protein
LLPLGVFLSVQRLQRLGTKQYLAVWRLHKVKLVFFHPAIEHAWGSPSNGGGALYGEHFDSGATSFAMQDHGLSVRPQHGDDLPFHRDLNVPRMLQTTPLFLPQPATADRFSVNRCADRPSPDRLPARRVELVLQSVTIMNQRGKGVLKVRFNVSQDFSGLLCPSW